MLLSLSKVSRVSAVSGLSHEASVQGVSSHEVSVSAAFDLPHDGSVQEVPGLSHDAFVSSVSDVRHEAPVSEVRDVGSSRLPHAAGTHDAASLSRARTTFAVHHSFSSEVSRTQTVRHSGAREELSSAS